MRTARRSKEQLKITDSNRADVFQFMSRFHARQFWTINGPPDTDIDEIICFCLFGKDGENLGIALVQTSWSGPGWDIYLPPTNNGERDATEAAIYRNRHSLGLLGAVQSLLIFTDREIEERKHSGNDEDWALLSATSDAAHDIVRLALGKPLLNRSEGPPVGQDLLRAAATRPGEQSGVDLRKVESVETRIPVKGMTPAGFIGDDTDYKALFFEARNLLNENAAAWDDEEDSVKAEHTELIVSNDVFLKKANELMTDDEKSEQYWESNTGHDREGKPLGGISEEEFESINRRST